MFYEQFVSLIPHYPVNSNEEWWKYWSNIWISYRWKTSLRFWFTGSKSCINFFSCMNNILYSGLDLFHKCSVNRNAYRYRVLNEMFVPQRVVQTPSGFLLADVWKYPELRFIKIWRASSTCEKGSYRNVLTSHLRYAYLRELSNYIAFLSAEHTSICSLRRALQ